MNKELLEVLKSIRDELTRYNELKEVELGIISEAQYKIERDVKKRIKGKNDE